MKKRILLFVSVMAVFSSLGCAGDVKSVNIDKTIADIKNAAVLFEVEGETFAGAAVSPDGKVLTVLSSLAPKVVLKIDDERNRVRPEYPHTGYYGQQRFSNSRVVAQYPHLDAVILDLGFSTPHYISLSPTGPKEGDCTFITEAVNNNINVLKGTYFANTEMLVEGRVNLLVKAENISAGKGLVLNEKGQVLGLGNGYIMGNNLKVLASLSPGVSAKNSNVSISAALPPQLMKKMLNSKSITDFSISEGDAEAGWESISFASPPRIEDQYPDVMKVKITDKNGNVREEVIYKLFDEFNREYKKREIKAAEYLKLFADFCAETLGENIDYTIHESLKGKMIKPDIKVYSIWEGLQKINDLIGGRIIIKNNKYNIIPR